VSRAVILSGVRTPIGRKDGALSGLRPDDLAATVIAEAVARAGVPSEQIEDVYFGAANQAGEDNRNVARMAALLSGLPETVAGITVNRLCASGLSAVVSACHAIAAGDGELFVAGGVESMSRAPLVTAKPEYGDGTAYDTQLGWRFPNPRLAEKFPLESMGETGENVAERWQISREEQDAFGLRSQQRWAAAAEAGRFDDELVTVNGVERDEHPRPDTTAGKLAALKPAFREGGTVTAGNASGINDGAAALVIASEEKVNVNGGAIAIGHPLGMSGARLVVSLLHELRRRRGRLGIAALCVGVGQGQAALFERVS
jgi:acetyl-CoA acetyltransferase family protein